MQSYLLKICIPCSGDSCSWDCPEPQPGAGSNTASSDGGGGHRRRGLLEALSLLGAGGGSGARLLLADEALDAYSCYQASSTCGPGSEPFWSQLAIIQAGGWQPSS